MGDIISRGLWIKRRRKALDLTQDELAQRVADRQVDPYSAAEELLRGLEVKL